MKLKVFLAIVGILLVVGVLGGIKAMQIMQLIKAGESFVPPPTAISVAEVETRQWVPIIPSVGSVVAVQGVTVSSEEPGTVIKIEFESGKSIEKGQVLIELDTANEVARLRAAEATLELRNLNRSRSRDLVSRNAVAQSELDAAESEAKQAQALLDAIQTTIDKKTVRAPFSGIAGIRQVNIGQYLAVGDPIVSLQAMDPVFVDFTLPQQRLAEVKTGMPVQVFSDAKPGVPLAGEISAMDSNVDSLTRNIGIRATLPNSEGAFRPGMFVRVEVLLPMSQEVTVVPASTVIYSPSGDSVFVIEEFKKNEDNKESPIPEGTLISRQRFVRLGERRGDFVAVTSGIKAGDRVVSSGAFKLRNNTPVEIKEEAAPAANETPTPPEA